MKAFDLLESWPVQNVSAAVRAADGSVRRFGDTTRQYELASITKVLSAAAVHLAVEEGSLALESEVGVLDHNDTPRGATLADALGHGGGFAPDGAVLDDPGKKRIYSNGGYELLARAVAQATEMPFDEYLRLGVFEPLTMASSVLAGSAAYAGRSTVDDLVSFLQGLPQLLAPPTIAAMTTPYLPELDGVLPGYGRQSPNLWGLGPEIRGNKNPHWTGATNSERTWGHFGQAGTFMWVDPECDVSVVVLTDQPFGKWALPLWPIFSDSIREEALLA